TIVSLECADATDSIELPTSTRAWAGHFRQPRCRVTSSAGGPRSASMSHPRPAPRGLVVAGVSLSHNPFTNVFRAVLELDAVCFAALEKSDSVSIHEGQVLQVQDDAAAVRFCSKEGVQLADMVCCQSTAKGKDDLAVRRSSNLQHPTLPSSEIGTIAEAILAPVASR